MTQKIEGSLPTAATLRTTSVGSKSASAGEDRTSSVLAASGSDSLRLTGEASNLQALQRDLATAPAVDSGRVQAVKEALQSGSYTINPDAIASRMLDLDSKLFG